MKKMKNEGGMVIAEASIVFPVMFFVIIFLYFAGNAYFQMCRVEAVVNRLTIEGAARCADPQLSLVEQNKIPSVKDLNVQPYRQIANVFTQNAGPTAEIQKTLEEQLRGMSTGLFSGMKPHIRSVTTTYKSYFVYSTFSAQVDYEITIPFRLLGEKDFTIIRQSVLTEVPASDSPELIRNVDMVQDYLDRTGATEKLKEMAQKVKDVFK